MRPAYGGLRSARWLRSFRYGPVVYAFRNLESGQVVFSQTLHPQQYYIDQQFKWPNWQNRKPALRRDVWRAMAAAEVPDHETAVFLYRNLVRLRELRDNELKKQARDWRRKNKEGTTWYWNQYRPTYTQEAVADLVSALESLGVRNGRVWWENEYRRGSNDHWASLPGINHLSLPRHNPREQPVVLNAIRRETLQRSLELQRELTIKQQRAADQARAEGNPRPAELRMSEQRKAGEQLRQRREARARQHAKLLEERPDLRDLEDKLAFVRRAEQAVAQSLREYDHFLPHGQRGPAKAPIKLRQRALRQAKRVYRAAKKRVAARNNKRRVPQPRVRRQM